MSEADRLLELRTSVEEFQTRRKPGEGGRGDGEEEDDALVVPEGIEDDGWTIMEKYVKAVKPFCTLAKYLSGDSYPTAGSVIPALEQIRLELVTARDVEKDNISKEYLGNLVKNMEKRFKDNWKKKSPYNTLTFLDPRNVDLYCMDQEVFEKVKKDIETDSVFDLDVINFIAPHDVVPVQPVVVQAEPTDIRSQLLKRKLNRSPMQSAEKRPALTFKEKLQGEINRYFSNENFSFKTFAFTSRYKDTPPIDPNRNPLAWWKEHRTDFPLLAKFVKTNGAFQATSVCSERTYNLDKLIYQDRRKSLDKERGSGLVVAQDYLQRRKNKEEYRLCSDCPPTQSKVGQTKYRISCPVHNIKEKMS